MKEAKESLCSYAESRRLAWSVTLPEERLLARADLELARLAVYQVLHNAVRYNREGGRIEIRGKGDPGRALLVVSDTGPGVPLARRENIFSCWARTRAEDRPAGLGLGLPLCRAIMTLHQGRVECGSAGETGSQFVMEWPKGERK